MAEPNSEEEIPQDILLQVAEKSFLLKHAVSRHLNVEQEVKELLNIFKQHNMIEFYQQTWLENGFDIDENLVKQMVENKEKLLKEYDEKKKEAEEKEGDVEVHDIQLQRADIIAKTSTLQEAIDEYLKITHLTSGKNIDKYLTILRLCLAWNDDTIFKKYSLECNILIDKDGDWDRRNRYNIYQAAHYFRVRDFNLAARKFLDAISTFTATEIFDYKRLVIYTVISSIVSLERVELFDKIINSPEINQVINDIPHLKEYRDSFYSGKYYDFFKALVEIMKVIRQDFYLSLHANYYLRETRLRAYQQFLQSYRSVKLSSMADSFGVSENFLDEELSSYIASSRLTCKIDKVNGVVEMRRVDHRNLQYQEIAKKGDTLLNKIQRLSRIISY